MIARIIVFLVLIVSVADSSLSQTAPASHPPNIIFILCDDLRWNTLGCMGDTTVQTPHIDALAKAGVLFRNHFVTTSICGVSRACIFTGQYARRHSINDFLTPFTSEQWAQTYPGRLRTAGYRSGFIGKWGVGETQEQVNSMAPKFDFWRGLAIQGANETSGFFIHPKDPTRTHITARMGNEALEFLGGSSANQPFCLSISLNSPHARDSKPREFEPDDRDEKLYTDVEFAIPKTATVDYFERLPASVKKSMSRPRWALRFDTPEKFQRTLRDYYRLVTGIDREVGRICETLSQRGLSENTIIVFTSDNGFFLGERGLADKWYLYEESIRVPLVIFDPRLPNTLRGRKVDAMTLNIDFAPTMLNWAQIEPGAAMQGRSLRPLLEQSAAPADWRTEFFYEHNTFAEKIAPSEGVRTTRWTYIRWIGEQPLMEELYDTANDPLQTTNLIADPTNAATLEELRGKWVRYTKELK